MNTLSSFPLEEKDIQFLRDKGDPGASEEVFSGQLIIAVGVLISLSLYFSQNVPIYVPLATLSIYPLGWSFLSSGKKRLQNLNQDIEDQEKLIIYGFIQIKREQRSKNNAWFYFEVLSGQSKYEFEVGITNYTRFNEGEFISIHIAKYSHLILEISPY